MQSFWKELIGVISKTIGKEIPVCPKISILGLFPPASSLKTCEQKLVNLCLLHAKRLIAIHWKIIHGPSLSLWIKEMSYCIAMERLTYSIKQKKCTHSLQDLFFFR